MLNAKLISFRRGLWLLGGSAVALALTACGGGGGGAAADGTLKLAMTDSPGCGYDHVYVTVSKIRIHASSSASDSDSGWREMVVSPQQRIDLLGLTNGALQELGSLPLPAGRYEQVRLVLAGNPLDNALVLSSNPGTEIALTTPSGQQSGYKLQAHFDVTGNQVADMVLDFDACKSIVRAGNSGNYNLQPVVAVTKRLTTQIEGHVDPAIAASVVVSTRDPDQQMRATVPDNTGRFVLAYLPENTNYTVVISGNGLTTSAVTGVPVSTSIGRTQLNAQTSPISPPASAMAQLVGTVTDSGSTPLAGASVMARQALSSQQLLDVAWTNADPDTAAYSLSLPLAAPVTAAYAGQGGVLNFVADNAPPGSYQVDGSATGYTTQTTDPNVTLGAAGSTTTRNLVLAP